MSTLPHTTSGTRHDRQIHHAAEDVHVLLTWEVRRRSQSSAGIDRRTVTAEIQGNTLVVRNLGEDGRSTLEARPIEAEVQVSRVTPSAPPTIRTIDIWSVEDTENHLLARLHRGIDHEWIVRCGLPAQLGLQGGTYRLRDVRELRPIA